MKKYNEDDGIYEHILKGAQVLISLVGVIFVVVAFFHTVKPAFDRDKAISEKEKAVKELKEVKSEYEITVNIVSKLKSEADLLRSERDNFKHRTEIMTTELQKKDSRLQDILQEKGDPAFAAVLNKLDFMVDDVFDEYLMHPWKNDGPPPLLIDVAKMIADKHDQRSSDAYTREAVGVFRDFLKKKVAPDSRDWKVIFDVTLDYSVARRLNNMSSNQ